MYIIIGSLIIGRAMPYICNLKKRLTQKQIIYYFFSHIHFSIHLNWAHISRQTNGLSYILITFLIPPTMVYSYIFIITYICKCDPACRGHFSQPIQISLFSDYVGGSKYIH